MKIYVNVIKVIRIMSLGNDFYAENCLTNNAGFGCEIWEITSKPDICQPGISFLHLYAVCICAFHINEGLGEMLFHFGSGMGSLFVYLTHRESGRRADNNGCRLAWLQATICIARSQSCVLPGWRSFLMLFFFKTYMGHTFIYVINSSLHKMMKNTFIIT